MNRLLTIPISHFCEKARWALDRAGVKYVEERHVQGIHRIVARRAGGGTTVPVLVTDEGVFGESEDILRYADERLGEERRLFPADAGLRDDVVRLCRELDEGLGPDGRRLMHGERFTAADLTFAALAAAVIVPPEYGVRLPQPGELPEHIARMVRDFREHPAGAYAMELFRTRRHGP